MPQVSSLSWETVSIWFFIFFLFGYFIFIWNFSHYSVLKSLKYKCSCMKVL